MNLYLTADGRYVGTQAEAQKLSRATGKGFTRETVPTDKEGLIDYLNAMRDERPLRHASDETIRQSNTPEAQSEAAIRMQPAPNPAARFKLEQGREVDQITDYIMDVEGWALGNIVSAALERMAQLAKGIAR